MEKNTLTAHCDRSENRERDIVPQVSNCKKLVGAAGRVQILSETSVSFNTTGSETFLPINSRQNSQSLSFFASLVFPLILVVSPVALDRIGSQLRSLHTRHTMPTISVTDVDDVYTANVIPAHIQYTGPANTSTFFTPFKATDAQNNPTAQFRGLRLVGSEIELPLHQAHVFSMAEQVVLEEGDMKIQNNYISVAKIDKLVVYGHDAVPAKSSLMMTLQEWTEVANVLHD